MNYSQDNLNSVLLLLSVLLMFLVIMVILNRMGLIV